MPTQSKHRLKQLFDDTSKLTPSKFKELIDALWREVQLMYAEQKICDNDLYKIDPEDSGYSARYVYVKNLFQDVDGTTDSSWSAALGFGNTILADFAFALGFGHILTAMGEIRLGHYSTYLEQSSQTWDLWERLLTIGNGTGHLTRNDALIMYKDGLIVLDNAIVIKDYHHNNPEGEIIPLEGTLRVKAGSLDIYLTGAWHPIPLTVLNGLSAYEVALANGYVGTEQEWLDSLHGADGEDGLSAYEIAVLNGFAGTEPEWLLSLQGDDGAPGEPGADAPDKFIELTDTPAAYPATNKGQLVKQGGAAAVDFTGKIGEDATGPWVGTGSTRSEGADIYSAGYASLTTDAWYHVIVVITGQTAGVATLEIDGNIVEDFTEAGTHNVYYQALATGSQTVEVLEDIDFDGTVTSIQVLPVTFSTGNKIRIVDADHADLTEIEVYKNEAGDTLLKLSTGLTYNVTTQQIAFGAGINSQAKLYIKTVDGAAIYGFSDNGYGGLFSKINVQSLSILGAQLIDQYGRIYPTAVADAEAPNNSIFRNITTDVLKYKDPSGTVYDLTEIGGGVPGTEALTYAASVAINWNGNTTKSLTITGACELTFGTPANYVVRVEIQGNYGLTLPATVVKVTGTYAGTGLNIIDFVPTTGGVWAYIDNE